MRFVVGVDSGGTRTRALAVSVEGVPIGYAETSGGHPGHDPNSRDNVREAIRQAAAPCGLENVVRVVAGISGLDRSTDHEWAAEATNVPGLSATRIEVNDAVVAHHGALGGRAGIVSIQGTGSMIAGRLEDGRWVRNFDFTHYAGASAIRLGQRCLHAMLIDPPEEADGQLVREMLAFWGVSTLDALRELGAQNWGGDPFVFWQRFGEVAPIVTAAETSPLAGRVCDHAAREVADGVRLIGGLFAPGEVLVTLIGGAASHPAIRERVRAWLERAHEREYRIVEPALPPVVGAALMALEAEGVSISVERASKWRGKG